MDKNHMINGAISSRVEYVAPGSWLSPKYTLFVSEGREVIIC